MLEGLATMLLFAFLSPAAWEAAGLCVRAFRAPAWAGLKAGAALLLPWASKASRLWPSTRAGGGGWNICCLQ